MTLNSAKCQFSWKSVKLLGHCVDHSGIRPDPDKVRAIQKVRAPANIAEIRRFLGVVNQMGNFAPNLAEVTQPHRELLKKGNQWTWDEPQQRAFTRVKEILTSSPVLALFDPNLDNYCLRRRFLLRPWGCSATEAANWRLKPVAYVSRSMTPTELRYAQIEKEALAFTWACECLSDYLLGLQFHIYTDHKASGATFQFQTAG